MFADGTEKVVDTTENYSNGKDKITNTIVTIVWTKMATTPEACRFKKVYETTATMRSTPAMVVCVY